MKTTEKDGYKYTYNHAREFKIIYSDIFKKKMYEIDLKTTSPKILDIGAHIGVATIYFKQQYPKAHIVSFEPNPYTFKLLEQNVIQNNLTDVDIVNAAVGDKDAESTFYISTQDPEEAWSWDNAMVKNKWYDPKKTREIKVRTTTLKKYLKTEVDLLKIDIEGMEERVLKGAEEDLRNVKNIVMEFHGSSTNPDNDIHRIVSLLERHKFKVKINQGWKFIPLEKLNDTKDPFWVGIHGSK